MSAYSDIVQATAGLVGYWRLGESSGDAIDFQGSNDGTVTGATQGSPGAFGDGDSDTSYTFDGVNDYVEIPYNAALNPSGALSIESWMYFTNTGTGNRDPLVSRDVALGVGLRVDGDGTLGYYFGLTGTYNVVDTAVAMPVNTWAHVVLTFTPSSGNTGVARMYLNGELINTSSSFTRALNTSKPMRFGAGFTESAASEFWPGRLDEVAFYNVALSLNTIQQHYLVGLLVTEGEEVASTEPGRAVRIVPALFSADKQNQLGEDISAQMVEGLVILDLDLDGAKMSFEATMKTKRAVSAFTDFVAPFLRMIYEDGSEDYEQVGLYALIPAPSTHYPGRAVLENDLGGTFQQIDGRDLCWLLAADHSDATISMAESTNVVTDAISDLASGGITRVNIPASSYTTTKAVDWPPGTSRLQRVNDRLMMAGYYTVAFDRHGIAISMPYHELATAEPAVTYTGANGSRIIPPVEDEPDITRLCNRVVVIGTDPAIEPIYAIRENVDPLSPVSFDNLGGVWISRTEEQPEIQTQEAADTLADELIRNGASYYRTLRIETLPDPSRNPREVYAIDLTNADGVVADGSWHCSGWELPLNSEEPRMSHFLNRSEAFQTSTP